MSDGQVRIRSNIVRDPRRWDLVPGELLTQFPWQRPNRPTSRQDDEQMYYVPCSICHRTIARINLEGCPRSGCSPSPAAAARARDEWRARVDAARRREASENAAILRQNDAVTYVRGTEAPP